MILPEKIKTKWLKALRTGGYEQATDTLYDEENGGFCCLGVLEHCLMDGEVEYTDGQYCAIPTADFYEWAGIDVKLFRGYYSTSVEDDDVERLTSMNDDGIPFTEIADYIEKNIKTPRGK